MTDVETQRATNGSADGRVQGEETRGADGTRSDASSAPLPPGPRGLPLLGNTVDILRDALGFVDSALEYGDVVRFSAFGTEFVGIADPAVVERVLVTENDRFRKGEYEQEFGGLIAPRGVVFTEGERWRRQRQLLQGAFTPAQIQDHASEMVAETARMVDAWADGAVIEVGEALSALTVRILARTLFAVDLAAKRGETVRRATQALSAYLEAYLVLSMLPSWIPSRRQRRYERAMADLDTLVADLVAERRAGDATGDDLLSTLAVAEYPDGSQMSPAEVRDQLVTFLFAGHETTSTALSFACWLLAGDDAAQSRLREEVRSVCPDRDPTFADLDELAFTEAVAREAMRLYPPVTELYREPREPTRLGGYRIPEDATLQLSAYAIHRDERWWEDPESFRPERWLPELRGADPERPEYAYFPFGGGPRHCLGMRFAMAELTLILATLCRRIHLERVTEELDLSMLGLTLDPGLVELRVHP